MAHSSDSRHSDDSWVTPNPEGLLVETLGPGSPPILEPVLASAPGPNKGEESGVCDSSCPEKAKDADEGRPSIGPKVVGHAVDVVPATLPSSCAESQHLEIPPDDVPGPLAGKSLLASNGEEGDVEEGSCSSSEDDVEGVRKRQPWGMHPSPADEADQAEANLGSSEEGWLTLNKCLVGALALVCISVIAFSGSLNDVEDASLENLQQWDLREGEKQSQILDDLRNWLKQHVQDSPGDVDSLQAINGLLDRLAKENQEIGLMRAQLQAQKEELQALLKKSEDEKLSTESQQQSISEENLQLRESLLQEERAHLSVKDELQALNKKVQALERNETASRNLMAENMSFKEELDVARRQIKDYLMQKEMLVAESQMLRQELNKQRMLVTSIRQDLNNLSSQVASSGAQGEALQQEEVLLKWKKKLALEFQRAETWENHYVKNRESEPEIGNDWIHLESLDDISNAASVSGDALERNRASKGPIHSNRKDWKNLKNEEWEHKRSEHGEARQEERWHHQKQQQRSERKDEQVDRKPGKKSEWKDKADAWAEGNNHQHQGKVQTGREHWPQENHHPKESRLVKDGGGGDQKKPEGHSKKESTHRHHTHNKFWKKLSNQQYRVPEGCTGIPDCALREGLDLFSTKLEPVKRQDFQQLLAKYLEKSNLTSYLPELTSVLSGFFQEDVFSHDKMHFRDFVDDVEDYLENIAEKEMGDDDAMDDFEDYVFKHVFGDAALKKRSTKSDTYHRKDVKTDSWGGKVKIYPQKSSSESEPEGEGSSHKSASPDELDHHNNHKWQHSKEERLDLHHKNPTQFNQPYPSKTDRSGDQESTKPMRERDIPSHSHQHNKKQREPDEHYLKEAAQHHKSHKQFDHKQHPKAEKSEHRDNHKHFNHESRAKHYNKNNQGSNHDYPLPEGRSGALKIPKDFNHERPLKEWRSSHNENFKEFTDKHEGSDHETSHPKEIGEERSGTRRKA